MWFKFPLGVEVVQVELQEFRTEVSDPKTLSNFFRAPDHFAPKIVELPGFKHELPPIELNPPEDLKPSDFNSVTPLDSLVAQIEALKSQITQANFERDQALAQLIKLEATCKQLEEENQDLLLETSKSSSKK